MPSNHALTADEIHPGLAEFLPEAYSWRIMICLLGEFKVLHQGELLQVHSSGKIGSLLRFLALKPGTLCSRESILDLLWPEAEQDLAVQSLNSLVYNLHKLLGKYLDGASPIAIGDGFYRLNSEAGLGVDVLAFDELAKQSEKAAQSGLAEMAAQTAAQAVQLYQGDLASSGDWSVTLELERLRTVYLTLLARLADASFHKEDYSSCLYYAHRLLDYDVCREDAHRMVMRCHVRRGERAAALRQFNLCRSILSAEFDALPEPATVDLFDLIRTNPQQV